MNAFREYFIQNVLWPTLAFLAVVLATGGVGNSLILYVFRREFSCSVTILFIYALAILDILSCIISVPIEFGVLLTFGNSPSDVFCKISKLTMMTLHCSSAILLTLIAFNRFEKFCRPTRQTIRLRKGKVIVIGTVLFSFLSSLPALAVYGQEEGFFQKTEYGFRVIDLDLRETQVRYYNNTFKGSFCLQLNSETSEFSGIIFFIFQFFFYMFLTILTLSFYVRIMYKIIRFKVSLIEKFSLDMPVIKRDRRLCCVKKKHDIPNIPDSEDGDSDKHDVPQPAQNVSDNRNRTSSICDEKSIIFLKSDVNYDCSNFLRTSQKDVDGIGEYSNYKSVSKRYLEGGEDYYVNIPESGTPMPVIVRATNKCNASHTNKSTESSYTTDTKHHEHANLEKSCGPTHNTSLLDIRLAKLGGDFVWFLKSVEPKYPNFQEAKCHKKTSLAKTTGYKKNSLSKTIQNEMFSKPTNSAYTERPAPAAPSSVADRGTTFKATHSHRYDSTHYPDLNNNSKIDVEQEDSSNIDKIYMDIGQNPALPPSKDEHNVDVENSNDTEKDQNEKKKKSARFGSTIDENIKPLYQRVRSQSIPEIDSLQVEKTTKILLCLSMVFAISFIPHCIIVLERVIRGVNLQLTRPSLDLMFISLFQRSGFLSNALNPIIYGFMNKQFRKGLKNTIKKWKAKRQKRLMEKKRQARKASMQHENKKRSINADKNKKANK